MDGVDRAEGGITLNEEWARRIRGMGAEFVYFVDAAVLPQEVAGGYACAVLFGKALSGAYIAAMRDGVPPRTKEVFNTEHRMDALAVKVAGMLQAEGYESVGKLKTGVLPHKTVALRAGLGFIGKNNLLVTEDYGCAVMLGKVLTTAPFEGMRAGVEVPRCGACRACVDACPTGALLGRTWEVGVTREEMLTRKKCVLCLKCMVVCPYALRARMGD